MLYYNYKESINNFVKERNIKKHIINHCNDYFKKKYLKECEFEDNIFELIMMLRDELRDVNGILRWCPFLEKSQLPFPIIITDTKTNEYLFYFF